MLPRSLAEAGFDGAGDSMVNIERQRRHIFLGHAGMVDEREGHSTPRMTPMGPGLGVSQRFRPVEGPLPFLRKPN